MRSKYKFKKPKQKTTYAIIPNKMRACFEFTGTMVGPKFRTKNKVEQTPATSNEDQVNVSDGIAQSIYIKETISR